MVEKIYVIHNSPMLQKTWMYRYIYCTYIWCLEEPFMNHRERERVLPKSIFQKNQTDRSFLLFCSPEIITTLLLCCDSVSSCPIPLHQSSAGWRKRPGRSHHLLSFESHSVGYNPSLPDEGTNNCLWDRRIASFTSREQPQWWWI